MTEATPDALPASKEAEAVAWQWLHYDPVSGEPIWHYERVRNGHTSNFSRALYTAIQPDSYAAMWERQAKTIGELQNEIDRLKQGSSLNERAGILTENFDQDHHITSDEAASFRLAYPPTDAGVSEAIIKALQKAEQFIVNGVELGYIRMPDTGTPDSAHDTLPAIRAALSTAAGDGVPPGMVLVPREPTPEMFESVLGWSISGPYLDSATACDIWDAMLSTASTSGKG